MSALRFITDGMLGKTTRWLRLLGHDVHYHKATDDNQLIELAKSEKRILLTRDQKLYQRAKKQRIQSAFVDAADTAEKLANLAKQLGLSLKVNFSISRCPKCNGKIEQIPKATIADQIPESTTNYYDNFWQCTECSKVYWIGSHWKEIEKTLERAKLMLEKQ